MTCQPLSTGELNRSHSGTLTSRLWHAFTSYPHDPPSKFLEATPRFLLPRSTRRGAASFRGMQNFFDRCSERGVFFLVPCRPPPLRDLCGAKGQLGQASAFTPPRVWLYPLDSAGTCFFSVFFLEECPPPPFRTSRPFGNCGTLCGYLARQTPSSPLPFSFLPPPPVDDRISWKQVTLDLIGSHGSRYFDDLTPLLHLSSTRRQRPFWCRPTPPLSCEGELF